MPGMYIGDELAMLGLDEIVGDYSQEYAGDELGVEDAMIDQQLAQALGLDEILGGHRRHRMHGPMLGGYYPMHGYYPMQGYYPMHGMGTVLGAAAASPWARTAAAAKAAAASKANAGLQAAQTAALARAAGGAVVQSGEYQHARMQILPIFNTYGPGAVADTSLQPQRTFRPERLAFSSIITPFFDITQINIGQDPQFVAAGRVPAELFSQVGVGVRLKGTTANLGHIITISAVNNDALASHNLQGGIFGTTLTM